MCILDRYIFKSLLGIFFGCLLAFLFLYIIIDIFSHLGDILQQHITFSLLFQYYSAYVPIIFVQIAPFVCLLATMYTFSNLNKNNEIIAMRSSGLSVLQIAKTALIFGFMLSIFVFWVNDRAVRTSLSIHQQLKKDIEGESEKKKKKEEEVIYQLFIFGHRNRLYSINKFFPATDTIEGIVILEQDEKQNVKKKIVANKGVYTNGIWKFYQSITYLFDENGQIINEPQYLEEEFMVISETPRDFLTQRQRPEFMNIPQLDEYIWKLSKSGAKTVIRNLQVDLYQRFSSPFTSLIIIMLGIPFAFSIRNRATGLSSIGLSIMVGFLYYVLDAVSIALGKAGILAPALSATLSHITALATALYLLSRLP